MEAESSATVASNPELPGKKGGATQRGKLVLRNADSTDIDHINTLIAAAMGTWQLADRVKRISLPLYRYHVDDFAHMQLVVAQAGKDEIVGLAALEVTATGDVLEAQSIMILHGMYVAPDCHRQGIGSRLLKHVEDMAFSQGADALLVKARPEAIPFFKATGFVELSISDCRGSYPLQLCKRFPGAGSFRSNSRGRKLTSGQE